MMKMRAGIIMLTGGLIIMLGIGWKFTNNLTGESRIYIPGSDTGFLKSPDLSWKQIPRHYTPTKGTDDWRKRQSARQWKKGFSAYELATAWEDANPGLPAEIQALFGGSAKLLAAIPEHKTPLPGGGLITSSQTDVLAFIRARGKVCAVAVEGKADEAFGPTVGRWLKDASANKIERLKYISKTLGLPYPPPDEIRYQLLHRTASAVIEARRFNADCAAMVVHSFTPNQELLGDYREFLKLFRIPNAKIRNLYETGTAKIPLSFGWVTPSKGSAAEKPLMDAAMLAVLAGALLLAFGFVLHFAGKKSTTASNPDQSTETATETDDLADSVQEMQNKLDKVLDKLSETESADVNQENGLKFEKYVVRKINQKQYSVVSWEGDKIVDGIYGETTLEPDLKLRRSLGGEEHLFAIECKWRGRFLGGKVELGEPRQLRNYQNYQRRTGQKTFVVLGVGGRADNPESVFIIPVEDLTSLVFTKRDLLPYYQTNNGNLSYDPGNGTLSL